VVGVGHMTIRLTKDPHGNITDGNTRNYWAKLSFWMFIVSGASLVLRFLFPASCHPALLHSYTIAVPATLLLLAVYMMRAINRDLSLYRAACRLDDSVTEKTYDWIFTGRTRMQTLPADLHDRLCCPRSMFQ
jgi:hypothetical protein